MSWHGMDEYHEDVVTSELKGTNVREMQGGVNQSVRNA